MVSVLTDQVYARATEHAQRGVFHLPLTNAEWLAVSYLMGPPEDMNPPQAYEAGVMTPWGVVRFSHQDDTTCLGTFEAAT